MTRRIVLVALFSVIVLLLASGIALAADFAWPVEGKVLRPFEKDVHGGIDIQAAEGTPVAAAASGKVIYARYKEGSSYRLDRTVSIQHNSEDLRTTYLQVRDLRVKAGDEVKQGDIIAVVDKSLDATTTKSHLHFGVKYGSDAYQNPLEFLPQLNVSEQPQDASQQTATVSEPIASSQDLQPVTPETVLPQVVLQQPVPQQAAPQEPVLQQAAAPTAEAPTVSEAPVTQKEDPAQVSIGNRPEVSFEVSTHAEAVSPLLPKAEPEPAALPIPSAVQKTVASTDGKSEERIVQSPLSPSASSLTSVVDSNREQAIAETAAITPTAEPLLALKDKQMEALAFKSSAGSDFSHAIKRVEQKALRSHLAAKREVLAPSFDFATVAKLLLYLLMLIPLLGFTRAHISHLGLPAYL